MNSEALPTHAFIFLRHGETDWNLAGRIMGATDIPLNATGRAQAEAAARQLKGHRLSRIFFSPLTRAAETARIIAEVCQAPLERLPGLAECDWGAMEGRVAMADNSDWRDAWRNGNGPEGAETIPEFRKRLMRALAATKVEDIGGALPLIVSHGGVFGVFRREAGNGDKWAALANAKPLLCEPPAKAGHPWRIVPL